MYLREHRRIQVIQVARFLSPKQKERGNEKHIRRHQVHDADGGSVCNAVDEHEVSTPGSGVSTNTTSPTTRPTYKVNAVSVETNTAIAQLRVSPLPMNAPMQPF